MNTWKSVIYWFVVGACIGLGAITIFSIGIAFLLIGVGLAVYGFRQGLVKNLWAAVVGIGAVPALLLTYQYMTLPSYLQDGGTQSGNNFPPGYSAVTIAFWAIAVVGLLWGLADLFLRHRAS
jgi:hypothetical protein